MRALAIAVPGLMILAVPQPASAQWYGHSNSYEREYRQLQRDCNRALRRADSRREYIRVDRTCRRNFAQLQRAYTRGYYQDGRLSQDNGYYDDRRRDRRRDRDDDDDDD